MVDFVYPSGTALQRVAQELLPRLEAARPVFDFFPIRNVDDFILQWEQADNYIGLQQVRGLNGDPSRVKPTGGKRFLMEPGVYGEFALIDERQMLTRRQYGTFQGPIDITDLVLEKQNQLLVRRLDRIEYIAWTLLAAGTFAVADGTSVLHTDAYTTQTFNANTGWGTAASSTPLSDMREVQLKSRGYSVSFGPSAKAYMNQVTFNKVLSNTNANDLGGRRVMGLQTVNGPDALNVVLSAEGLPSFSIYDQGYYDDNGTFQQFIADDVVIVIGSRRDGDPVGEYRMVRNVNNPDMGPGAYMKTIDRQQRVPRQVEVHDGHNGGPVLFHPAAIVVMDVS